jgi:hypothetical protein
MDDSGGSKPKWSWVAQLGLGPAPPVLVWPSWPPSLTSCAPEGSRNKILMLKKSQVSLNSVRFLKHKNTQNRVFMFCRVIIKIRGIDGDKGITNRACYLCTPEARYVRPKYSHSRNMSQCGIQTL